MLRRVFLIFGLLIALSTGLHAATVLSTVQQIRQLTPAQVDQGTSVKLEGVVTYYDPAEHILFIEDRTGAIFVRTRHIFPFVAGDQIQVRGITAGSYHVVVASETMHVIGTAPLPVASPAVFPELMAGKWDCSYVTVSGTVLSATMQGTVGAPFLLLELLMDGGPVDVHIENPEGLNPHGLLDSRVVLTGVSGGRFDGKFQLVGANLYLNSPADMRITARAPTDPAALPLTPMDKVMGSYNVVEHSRRVRIRGSVTLYEPGSQLVVEDAGKAVLVHTHQNIPLQIGDVVYATGFADADDYTQSLEHGPFSPTGKTAMVRPQRVRWEDAIAGKYAFNLISMDGRLIEQVHEPSQDTLFVNSGGHVFSSVLRHSSDSGLQLPSFPVGSHIRVSGVCFVENGGPWNNALGFELHLRGARDVQVLARPPWWTVSRLLYLVGALGLVIFIAAIWGEMLRHRVHQQTQLIRHGMEEDAGRERRQAFLEKERSRVLEAINSLLPLDEVLRMITDLIRKQMDCLDCCCEVAASGSVTDSASGSASNPGTRAGEQRSRRFERDILSRSGERLGSLILAWSAEDKPVSLRSEVLDMGVSLAALAIDNRRLYESLVRRSEYDQLTDVPNRFYLESFLKEVLDNARRDQHCFALIYIDLDRFKSVNDRYGHRIGDIYLQHIARRLSEKLRGQDTLARVGGDEFIVLVPTVQNRDEAEEIGWRLGGCFDSPFQIDGKTIEGSASIGIALYPEDGADEDQLKRFADSAMYATKHRFSWLGAKA
ncbi:MAG: GGDEF domain-containing protein [Acidobacteriaceae bacterium]